MDEQDINQQILEAHQELVSIYLPWAGIEEERAVYLGDYNNVVRDLAVPSPDDWALVRAAMLHIASSEELHLEHNQWLGQEIFASFEKTAKHHLYFLASETRRGPSCPSGRPAGNVP